MIGGPNYLSVDDGSHGTTAKGVAIEGRIAAFGERAINVEGPGPVGVKECDVGG
jgi:hypothetical protein